MAGRLITWSNPVVSILIIVIGSLIDFINADYCWYIHEDYYIRQTKYCVNGCCSEYGDDDEICCFEWTVGIILGICFAVIAVIAGLIALVVCCVMAKKKRARTGVLLNTNQPTNTFIHTSSSTMHPYSYPHPPSGFYPSSQFPNAAPQPIPNFNAGNKETTDPAFPPPPSYSQVIPPSYTQATAPPPPTMYGGYGTGTT